MISKYPYMLIENESECKFRKSNIINKSSINYYSLKLIMKLCLFDIQYCLSNYIFIIFKFI